MMIVGFFKKNQRREASNHWKTEIITLILRSGNFT
jgi:hypothetical protein